MPPRPSRVDAVHASPCKHRASCAHRPCDAHICGPWVGCASRRRIPSMRAAAEQGAPRRRARQPAQPWRVLRRDGAADGPGRPPAAERTGVLMWCGALRRPGSRACRARVLRRARAALRRARLRAMHCLPPRLVGRRGCGCIGGGPRRVSTWPAARPRAARLPPQSHAAVKAARRPPALRVGVA